MKKSLLLGLVCASMIGLSGCARVPSHLGFALVQADTEPVAVTELTPKKMGMACGFNLLGIFATGDISIENAKRDGGIRRVASVDKDVFSILGLFSKVCIRVTGE
jgi:hypothetical protein